METTIKGSDCNLQQPAVKWRWGAAEMNWKGGRQNEGGQAGSQSPTSNNLSLYQSQHAWPLPLPVLPTNAVDPHQTLSLSNRLCLCLGPWFVFLCAISCCNYNVFTITMPCFITLNLLDRSECQKRASPCRGIVSSSLQKWSASYKNWLQGRNILLGRITKQPNLSIKCQNMRAIQRKQDQRGCKTLGGLSLDKHCRWSCIQDPDSLFPNAGKCQHQCSASLCSVWF